MSIGHESKQVLRQEDVLNNNVKNTTDVVKILDPWTLLRLGALVMVAQDAGATMTITVTRRILAGSDTGAVAVDTIVVPDGTAAGKCVYAETTPTDLNVGDELLFSTQDVGTSSAYQVFAVGIPRSETALNQSDMILSA
jgi:hypothetical protein